MQSWLYIAIDSDRKDLIGINKLHVLVRKIVESKKINISFKTEKLLFYYKRFLQCSLSRPVELFDTIQFKSGICNYNLTFS